MDPVRTPVWGGISQLVVSAKLSALHGVDSDGGLCGCIVLFPDEQQGSDHSGNGDPSGKSRQKSGFSVFDPGAESPEILGVQCGSCIQLGKCVYGLFSGEKRENMAGACERMRDQAGVGQPVCGADRDSDPRFCSL